jgi:hypothetical protein
MRFLSASFYSLLVVAFAPMCLHGQGPHINSIAATTTELSASAQLRLAPDAGLRADQSLATDFYSSRPSRQQGEILMIVGGAGILIGLLADEALITIAGAAIGGYGLYVYLSASPKRRR